MSIISTVSEKKQLKMYVTDDVLDRLEAAARRTNRGSKQDVVAELIEFYLPVWERIEIETRKATLRQMGHLTDNNVDVNGKLLATKSKSKLPFVRTKGGEDDKEDAA